MRHLLLPLFCCTILFSACQQTPATQPEPVVADENYYTEPHRPQFHFSPEKKWMNDPNGLVFLEGEYHLFYQHYPEASVWGPMHWGHAVSRDLVHWEHLPIALYPDSLGYIFSGSAVVDWNNTSGLGENGNPPMVAIFTQHDSKGLEAGRNDFQCQSLAYSNDKGRTWTKFEGNPIVPNTQKIKDFRDPKVIWDKNSEQWVMALAAGDHVKFYGSPDLKNWTHLSDFGREWGSHGGVWECPDLFPMNIENSDEKKWILLLSINPGGPNGGSATQYFIGNFDGKNFTLDPDFAQAVKDENAVWLDWGNDNYAGVTWSNAPDGRRIFIGWMSNWDYAQVVPTEIWRSAMTLPRNLVLAPSGRGLRLFSKPTGELDKLRRLAYLLEEQPLTTESELTDSLAFSPSMMEVLLEIEYPQGSAANFGIVLSNPKGEEYRLGFDAGKNEFYSDRSKAGLVDFAESFAPNRCTAPRPDLPRTVRMQIFFDVSSCELFADWGTVAMTEIFFPTENFTQVKLYTEGGEVKVKMGEFYQLASIWR